MTTRISSYDLEYLARRHEELLDALSTREPEKAAQAMQRHIEELGKPLQLVEAESHQSASWPKEMFR